MTMITPSYLGETIEYSSLHACRSTLEDPTPPGGIAGGKAGGRARFVVRLGSADEHETRASGRYEMKAGERFLLQSAAGGGFGDPEKRERDAIARDLAEGCVTAQAAKEDYGDGQ